MAGEDAPAETALRLRIAGRVQGVGYRAWAAGEARALGLAGFVRNRLDGTVELVARGPREALAALAAACRRGPPGARVDRIDAEPALGLVPDGFAIKPTV
jgi:acylphosphatase